MSPSPEPPQGLLFLYHCREAHWGAFGDQSIPSPVMSAHWGHRVEKQRQVLVSEHPEPLTSTTTRSPSSI